MLIDNVKSPEDIKGFSKEQLEKLAEEIRKGLMNRLSKKGGHFGPNFGFVEATIALHYVFNSPVDKFVFDVSHQSYVHKMLTGRKDAYFYDEHFADVSGYTNPEESEHDFFNVGHTSTSISLACGLAKGRDLKGDKENIVAVIGDGSLSGGEALEGLDFASELNSNFIIIVNDNDMSIAENHGGLYKNLKLLRDSDGKCECNLFKAMGLDYRYVGDGNNIESLIKAFEEVKDIDHPVVVHINTLKGKGYKPAETNKENWHWCMPFDVETGKSYVDDFGEDYGSLTCEYLLKKMKQDKSVVVLVAAVPTGKQMYLLVAVYLFCVSTDGTALAGIPRVDLDYGRLVLFRLVDEFLFKVIESPRYRNIAVLRFDTFCGITDSGQIFQNEERVCGVIYDECL